MRAFRVLHSSRTPLISTSDSVDDKSMSTYAALAFAPALTSPHLKLGSFCQICGFGRCIANSTDNGSCSVTPAPDAASRLGPAPS
jgi:hypothetical protein